MVAAAKPLTRAALVCDAPALAQLAETTFREAFAHENTATDMQAYCAAHFGAAIQRAELDDPNAATFVAEVDRRLIGYAQIRWSEAPACVRGERPAELRRLYVSAAWHGSGVAQDLMRCCLDDLVQRGFDVAWLGVWERNPRAIRFYQKFGFRVVGEQNFKLGNDLQRDLVLIRSLREASGDL